MIVPGMTLPEIRQSVLKDYQSELRNKLNSITVTHQRKWQVNGCRDTLETILFPTKSKNDWRIIIECTSFGASTMAYLVSYNTIGITASFLCTAFDSLSFMHFNTHFFKRYKERLKLKIEKPEELVKTFFKKNRHLFPGFLDMEDGSKQLFVPLRGGVGLGIHHPDDDIYEFKTFVDDSLLKENQRKRIEEINTTALLKAMSLIGLPLPEIKA
jgi:hypothetical protein